MIVGDHDDEGREQHPGVMHPVDEAFYRLAVKERDYERVKVDRLEVQLAGAVEERDELRAFVKDFLSWQTTADLNRLAPRARDLLDRDLHAPPE